ncbi:tyrosine-type recombinase/integrase [Geopsychrobacter electrodiphilus]|uniref:tyrosine-type recombinase/integrase n=1 Tax=Geopsychrobacter electrodiphilus TaxID=225196 RepID=UPI0003751897|nr:site-specific integrase [Geopsychrobacter electrodiphilus]
MAIRHNKTKNGDIIPGSWVIDYYPEGRNGRRTRQIVNDCSEIEVHAIEMQLRRRRSGIKNLINPRIVDVLPDWLEWVSLHRAPKTYDSILWALKNLKPHFGALTIGEITEIHINKYKTKRKSTPRSCNLEIDYLKSLISWMVERKMCDPLPFRVQRLAYEAPQPKIPSPAELHKWLDHIDNGPKKAIIYIMLRAGLRYAEASRLKWQDVNLIDGVIYYIAKRGKTRASILPEEAIKILAGQAAIVRKANKGKYPTGYIAANPKTGEPYASMKKAFATASRKSGVPIKGPHTLRHICGTYTLEATNDLRLVQETLGHTQIRTTEKYTQISLARLRDGQQRQSDHTGQLD